MVDRSFGIIPTFNATPRLYLLIYQIQGYWSFPKGHKESDETPLQAAIRELAEETGIESITLIPNKTFVCSYRFQYFTTTISKTVTYAIGVTTSKVVHVDNQETINFFWGTYDECIKRLRHSTNKRLLKSVDSYLNSLD